MPNLYESDKKWRISARCCKHRDAISAAVLHIAKISIPFQRYWERWWQKFRNKVEMLQFLRMRTEKWSKCGKWPSIAEISISYRKSLNSVAATLSSYIVSEMTYNVSMETLNPTIPIPISAHQLQRCFCPYDRSQRIHSVVGRNYLLRVEWDVKLYTYSLSKVVRSYTYKNCGDAKSFVREDNGAADMAKRRCEIDAVIPRSYLHHIPAMHLGY